MTNIALNPTPDFPRILLLLLSLALLVPGVHGQDDTPLVRTWQTEDGLPSNTVRAIAQTPDGFLWLGTDAGLVRFDGIRFVTQGMRSWQVLTLLAQPDGTLWIGCTDGLVRMRAGVFTTYTGKDGLPSSEVNQLELDDAGGVWAVDSGILFHEEDGRFVHADSPEGKVQALVRRRSGELWVSTSDSKIKILRNGKWMEAEQSPDGRFGNISALAEDAQGQLWAISTRASHHLILRLNSDGWKSFPIDPEYSAGAPLCLGCAPDGSIFLGSYGGSVGKLRGQEFLLLNVNDGSGKFLVEKLFVDRDGQLWIGTQSSGLVRLAPRKIESCRLDPGGNTDVIRSLLEIEPGVFWAGTLGAGLWQWKAGRAEPVPPSPGYSPINFGNVMLRARDGSVWLGSESPRQLHEFRQGKCVADVQISHASDSALALAEDAGGTLWVGCASGRLYRMHDGKAELFEPATPMSSIKGLAFTPDGALWAATDHTGIRRIRGAEVTNFTTAAGLPSNRTFVVQVDQDGVLWAGTAGGLACWRNGQFQAIDSEAGIPDDTVTQILDDGTGQLWLGTPRGLAAIEKSGIEAVLRGSAAAVHPRVFGRSDGMVSADCGRTIAIRASDGRLCFGTTRGFVRVDPTPPKGGAGPPAVFLDELSINGKARCSPCASPWPDTITLGPGPMRLDLSYTAPELATAEQLHFRYRLDGLDKHWHEVGGQRSVNFSGLQAGLYRFEVAAAPVNGIWSPHTAVVKLRLLPHFWQTSWFYAICATVAALLLAGMMHWLGRLRAARELAASERRRAVDAERVRIARDLHDDLGSSLAEMAFLSELTQASLADPQRARNHLDRIFVSAQKSAQALDEIVWAADPARDNLQSFVEYIAEFARTFLTSAGLSCRFAISNALPEASISAPVRHHLYLAVKEALHNAGKHAGATQVILRVTVNERLLRIALEDDGCGFNLQHPPAANSDGIANMKQRLTEIGGAVALHTAPGTGTTVEFSLPLENLPE